MQEDNRFMFETRVRFKE